MTFPQSLRPLRIRVSILLVLTAAIILTQIPLFNYLGYEFSVMIALCMSVISGVLTIRSLRLAFKDRQTIAGEDLWKLSSRDFLAHVLLLLIPLVVITVNLAAVKNCSYAEGLGFYFLIPVVTTIFCIALATLCFALFRHSLMMYGLILALILFHVVWVGYFSPQIYAYNLILGYFPGFSYDEVLPITPLLIGFRLLTLIAAACCFSLSVVLVQTVSQSNGFPARGVKLIHHLVSGWSEARGIFLATFVIVFFAWLFRVESGFESSHRLIESILDRVVQTDHFKIRYASGSFSDEEIHWIAAEHEFQLHQITQQLQVSYGETITSYIYPSADVKRQLIGAGQTSIAKPWLREIHLNRDSWKSVLKHEIAHVVAGDFGMPVIRAHYNIGLVEGLAMAVEWDFGNRTLHEYAASMEYFGVIDDVTQVLSIEGFVLHASVISYVVNGSFCRFLLDRYGVVRFKEIYGGKPFERVYGRTVAELAEEWERFLRLIRVDDAWSSHVWFYFDRKPIFAKECARYVARLNENGYRELQRGDLTRAAYYFDSSLRETWNTEGFSGLLRTAYRMQQYDTVIQLMQKRMETNYSDVVHLLIMYGDALWGLENLLAARNTYQEVVRLDLSEALTEAASLRLVSVEDPAAQAFLRPFFIEQSPDSARLKLLENFPQQHSNPVIHLLKARLQFNKRDYDGVLQSLERAKELPDRSLCFLREKLSGESNFSLRRFEQARVQFWQALNYTTNEASRLRLNEWIDRCEWMAQQGKM